MQGWLIFSSTTPSRVAQTCTVRKDVSRFHSFITSNLTRQVQRPGIQPSPPSGWSSYGRRSAAESVRPPGRGRRIRRPTHRWFFTGGGLCNKGPLSTTSSLYATLPACPGMFRPVENISFYDPHISRPPNFDQVLVVNFATYTRVYTVS